MTVPLFVTSIDSSRGELNNGGGSLVVGTAKERGEVAVRLIPLSALERVRNGVELALPKVPGWLMPLALVFLLVGLLVGIVVAVVLAPYIYDG